MRRDGSVAKLCRGYELRFPRLNQGRLGYSLTCLFTRKGSTRLFGMDSSRIIPRYISHVCRLWLVVCTGLRLSYVFENRVRTFLSM